MIIISCQKFYNKCVFIFDIITGFKFCGSHQKVKMRHIFYVIWNFPPLDRRYGELKYYKVRCSLLVNFIFWIFQILHSIHYFSDNKRRARFHKATSKMMMVSQMNSGFLTFNHLKCIRLLTTQFKFFISQHIQTILSLSLKRSSLAQVAAYRTFFFYICEPLFSGQVYQKSQP